jgi:hypothetical protein
MTLHTKAKRIRTDNAKRAMRRGPPKGADHPSAERARSQPQKAIWAVRDRRRWWERTEGMPPLPLPRDKVTEKDLAFAKTAAIEAMQEFGVLVEAGRASGMGHYQIAHAARADEGDKEFAADIRRARRQCQERLEGAFLARGMTKGGDLAGIFYLKHNLLRYREVSRLELTGKDGAPIQVIDAAKAQLLERLGKLAESVGSREGLEGRQEIVVGGSAGSGRGPRLLKGAEGPEVKRSGPRRAARD